MVTKTEDVTGVDFLESFCSQLTGEAQAKFRAAVDRRTQRIAEIGYPAYRAEMDARKKREIDEAMKGINIGHAKKLLENSGLGAKFFERTFKTFRATKANMEALSACIEVADGNRKKGVILSGGFGVGKTHLAAAIVNHLAGRGVQAYFGNIVEVVDEVKDSFKTGTEKVIARILDCKLIVIDDLGAEHTKQESGWIDSLLYKIINRAYEDNKTLVVTTNLTDYDLSQRYNTRIISRLHEMCDFIRWDEPDQRLTPTDEKMPWDNG